MPTLPLKPLSSSNNFSTYISFLPPWEKKKKNPTPYFFSKAYFKVVGAGTRGYQKGAPTTWPPSLPEAATVWTGSEATWGPCSQPQAQETFPLEEFRLQYLWQKSMISSQLCLSFLGHLLQTRKWTCDDSVDFSRLSH